MDIATGGHVVRSFRDRFGLTQQEVGAIVGRSRGTIAAWERATNTADPAAVHLLRSLSETADVDRIRALTQRPAPIDSDAVAELRRFIAEAEASPEYRPLTDGDRYIRLNRSARLEAPIASILRMSAADAGMGGTLVPPDRLRDADLPPILPIPLAALGAQVEVIASQVDEVVFPRLDALPTVQWLGEQDEVTASTPTLFRAASGVNYAGTAVPISRRFMKLTGGRAEALVMRSLVASLSQAAARAAIFGAGSLEPLGVLARLPLFDRSPACFMGFSVV